MIWSKLSSRFFAVRDGTAPARLLLGLLLVLGPVHAPAREPVTVGVLAPRGEARALANWQGTMDELGAQVPGYRFQARPLNLEGLEQAVADAEVDFVLTNAGQFVLLGTPYGLSWLATLLAHPEGSSREAIGSVMLVRADSAYREPRDLRRLAVAAVHPRAFGGYLLVIPSLAEHGVRPTAFDLRFAGYPVDALLYQLRDGTVEAAIVPTCLLEQMDGEGLLDASRFRALMEREPVAGCRSSTPAYPDWSFAALPHVSEALAADVARALLQDREGRTVQWGAPVSPAQVESLFRQLALHPMEESTLERLQTLLWRYRHYTALLVALMLAGLLHHVWVQRLANRRARELHATQLRLGERERELAAAQQLNVLGEMASVLAHELNQPLAAIRHYAEGSAVRLAREDPAHPLLPILGRIEQQADRGAAVIEQARQWLRHEVPPATRVPVEALLQDVAQLHRERLRQQGIYLDIHVEPAGLVARGNRLALEQVLSNLISNSLQAYQAGGRPGGISIRGAQRAGTVELTVRDQAGGFSPEQLREPFSPLRTTREEGLGLGLLICRRLMNSQGGSLELANCYGGAEIRLILPGEKPQ